MKRLLEMVEFMRADTAVAFQQGGIVVKDAFFQAVAECQPFVFAPLNKGPEPLDIIDYFNAPPAATYAAPFKVWSAEMAGDAYIASPHPVEARFRQYYVLCFIAVEDEGYFVFVEDAAGARGVVFLDELGDIPAKMVERINSDSSLCGSEHVRKKFKIGSGRAKRHVKIDNVIHIRHKRSDRAETSESGRTIHWSHRWWRRASWVHFWLDKEAGTVDTTRIGKCRDGCYCQPGRTWRVESLVGPEHMPIITKQRIVEGGDIATN